MYEGFRCSVRHEKLTSDRLLVTTRCTPRMQLITNYVTTQQAHNVIKHLILRVIEIMFKR